MFCTKCRRRILFKKAKKQVSTIFNQYSTTDEFVIYYSQNPIDSRLDYLQQVSKDKMTCPACKEETGKKFKVKLGVSERIESIATYKEPKHPDHRPVYINAVPLVDIIRSIKNIKSPKSKTVLNYYNNIIREIGNEFEILTETPINKIETFDDTIAFLIKAIRNNEIKYTPGGGGTYGKINLDL
jgi:PHP family Zn ribbon phosphoesterase